LEIYLDQENCETSPTSDWKKASNKFNQSQSGSNIQVRVWSKRDTPCSNAVQPNGIHIFYDRHGIGVSKASFNEDFLGDHAYILLDKLSSDFVTLFSPRFPINDEPWILPYELAEAGLLNVLVIDERIAEGAYKKVDLTTIGTHFKKKEINSPNDEQTFNVSDVLHFHLAWGGKAYICTHFDVVSQRSEHTVLHSTIKEDCKSLADYLKTEVTTLDDQFTIRLEGKINGREVHLDKLDMLIIHQGILDHIGDEKERYDFLKKMQMQIPFVIVDSGRGIPHTLAKNIKFLPFSLIQSYLGGERIAKHSLTRIAMSLSRRPT